MIRAGFITGVIILIVFYIRRSGFDIPSINIDGMSLPEPAGVSLLGFPPVFVSNDVDIAVAFILIVLLVTIGGMALFTKYDN